MDTRFTCRASFQRPRELFFRHQPGHGNGEPSSGQAEHRGVKVVGHVEQPNAIFPHCVGQGDFKQRPHHFYQGHPPGEHQGSPQKALATPPLATVFPHALPSSVLERSFFPMSMKQVGRIFAEALLAKL